MIEYEKQTFEENIPTKIVCDVCKKEVEIFIDSQEVLYINFTGGYGSVFGDGNQVQGEICQDCVRKLLGKYLRVNGEPLVPKKKASKPDECLTDDGWRN
jgi:hypothetical protein